MRDTEADFTIVYRDEWLLVLDKPSGLLSVPGKGEENADNLATRVQTEFPQARVVHRLDRDTSGLIVMALDLETQRGLSRQFEERTVMKRYVAVVSGVVVGDEGEIELAMRKDFDRPPRHMIDSIQGRPALTRWRGTIGSSSPGVTVSPAVSRVVASVAVVSKVARV